MKTYETNHYIFTYEEGSLAEKDIVKIALEQEKSFYKICNILKVAFPEKIKYYLLDSREEVGKLYGNSGPINGFAVWGENKVYAVYNEKIKCIGPHEDAHLISFVINNPETDFIVEGLAMYFDEKWWDVDNDCWASYYKTNDNNLSIVSLLNNEKFYEYDCEVTYPLSGSFTKYLIDEYGIDKYLDLYKIKGELRVSDFEKIFNSSFEKIEVSYWKKIKNVKFDLDTLKLLLNNKC